MAKQIPFSDDSSNQPLIPPTKPSAQSNNHMDGNSQKQTDLQTSTLSSSSSGDPSSSDSSSDPEPTFTPFPAHSAAQSPDSDSSSDNQCDNERQVRFRSYESIRYFHEDTPTGSPSLYPNTHRRKTRFRKKPFPPDTYISCGRSIFETREEDSIHEFHSGNYGRSEDYFLWDDMLQEQRVVSKLKRSNTVPSSAQRSFSKDEACGFYRISLTTHGCMVKGKPIDGGQQPRTIRPFQLMPVLFDFDIAQFQILHQCSEMSRSDVEDWLTEAASHGPPWASSELLPLEVQSTSPESLSSSAAAIESTSLNVAASSSATAANSPSPDAISLANQMLTSFAQGFSTSNASSRSASALSSPKSFKSKSKRRSTPATTISSRYPSQSQFYQLGAVATQSSINIAAAESSSIHRQEGSNAGVGRGSGFSSLFSPPPQPTSSPPLLGPTSTSSSPQSSVDITPVQISHSTTVPIPLPWAAGSVFRYPSNLAMSRQQAAVNSSLTETFSCSSPQRQREIEQEQQRAREHQGHRRTNAPIISQFLTPAHDVDQTMSSLAESPSRNLIPEAIFDSTPPTRNGTPVLQTYPNFEVIPRQRQSLINPPPDMNEKGIGSIGVSSSTCSPSGSSNGIKIGTACGATLENSTSLLSSGPLQSNWLTSPSLNDLSLLAPKYRIPRPATVSPILHAVMSAASNGLSSNNFYGNSPEDEDEDVPVLNLALQPSAVPRNAAREVNTESSSSHNQPQSPRTANESENIRRGKQTDRSIRDSQRQIVQKQILEHDQIQEILEDYYIDEEQIVDEDEYDDDREAKGKGEFATGDDDTQALILNGKDKKKKKKTLLQRAKNALSKKLKKTSETG